MGKMHAAALAKIKTKIAGLFDELKEIQTDCPHENLEGEFESNTGNYCSQDDSYSLFVRCPDCEFVARYDRAETEYRTLKFIEKKLQR